jgi:hypothetical protein
MENDSGDVRSTQLLLNMNFELYHNLNSLVWLLLWNGARVVVYVIVKESQIF